MTMIEIASTILSEIWMALQNTDPKGWISLKLTVWFCPYWYIFPLIKPKKLPKHGFEPQIKNKLRTLHVLIFYLCKSPENHVLAKLMEE